MAVSTLLCQLYLLCGAHSIHSASLHNESPKRNSIYSSSLVQTQNGTLSPGTTDSPCPPGFFGERGHCNCSKVLPPDVLKCSSENLLVMDCICVTMDNSTRLTSVGGCIFNCKWKRKNTLYFTVAKDLNSICMSKGRTGRLCGECLPDHYPLAYSFNMSCIPCPNVRWNWVRYIMAAYLPLTLFSFFILFFKIRATNGHVVMIVTFCQSLSLPILSRLFLSIDDYSDVAGKLFFSLIGIWNLDFFRPFYSDLCLGIGVLPTLALDYAIAVYPLLLMIISYLFIVLYDRNYRVVTIMWRPFRVLFSLFRRNWDIRTSVIDSYATFFFLSNIKFLSVSFDFLIPVTVFQLHPIKYSRASALYYSGDLEYFGGVHRPYAILALTVLLFLVILPIALLLLYPFKFFHRSLNLFPGRWYILHTFVDSFQGCYKDGTDPGCRDYRWFSAVYFMCRILFLVIYACTLSALAFAYIAVLLLFLVMLIVALKPFKKDLHNLVNAGFLQLFACAFVGAVSYDLSLLRQHRVVHHFSILTLFIALTPFLYGLGVLARWLFKNRGHAVRQLHVVRSWRRGYSELPGDSFSDRINNPEAYHRENLSSFVNSK